MAPHPVRRLWTLVEPLAAAVYFAPEANAAYASLGALDGFWAPYYASRGACLGETPALAVAAAFGVFNPDQMVEELDARSARLAATRLSDRLAERVTWLEHIAASRDLTLNEVAEPLFDGGLARFDASGQVVEAFPSLEAWRARPVAELLATRQLGVETESNQPIFSPLFVDPLSNRDSLLIGWS